MHLNNNLGEESIINVLKEHPTIGDILVKYDIGCVTCGVGVCLLKDVVAIHALGAEIEAKLERELNDYIESKA